MNFKVSAQPVGLRQILGFGLIQIGLGPLCAVDSFELRHDSQGCSGGLLGALSRPHLQCRTLLTVADFTTQWVQRRLHGIRRFRAEQGWAFPSLSPAYIEFSVFRLRVSTILQNYGIASPLTHYSSASVSGVYPFGVCSGPRNFQLPQNSERKGQQLPAKQCLYLASHHSPYLEVPMLWLPPCLTSLAQTPSFLLSSHLAFLQSLEPLSALPLQSSGQIGTTGKE